MSEDPVLRLANAAWVMCVEQQHHSADGWSMAKSWAWDRLREAVEPFLVRDKDGDVQKIRAIPTYPTGTGWPAPQGDVHE